ncbi:MAG: hypothetical protein PHC64_01280 [Candidatus Gastranaerophilales bacterium]|nr:hypothetical protein [Candidatus Gastranaerophilales bacterium]
MNVSFTGITAVKGHSEQINKFVGMIPAEFLPASHIVHSNGEDIVLIATKPDTLPNFPDYKGIIHNVEDVLKAIAKGYFDFLKLAMK